MSVRDIIARLLMGKTGGPEDTVDPQFEVLHSTEADPATQNFNTSFRQLFSGEPPRTPSMYQFNEDYARSLGMSEEQIRKRRGF
jgi:hypothetical protein